MRTLTNDTDFYVGSDLMVYSNGYEECEPNHQFGPGLRQSWLLHYISVGKGIFTCKGKDYALKAGDLFLCRPGEVVSYKADEKEPWGYGWIGLQGTQMADYFSRTALVDEPVARYDKDSELSLLFIQVQQAYSLPDNLKDIRLNGLAYQLLDFLIRNFPKVEKEKTSSDVVIVQSLIGYITTHLSKPIRVDQMCKALGVSRSYASKLFTKKTGISLRDYIWKSKESEACRLLEQTSHPIGLIARSLGYDDPLYFSRLFHDKVGMPPSEYRKGKRISTRSGQPLGNAQANEAAKPADQPGKEAEKKLDVPDETESS